MICKPSPLAPQQVAKDNSNIKNYRGRYLHKSGRAFCSDLYTIVECREEEEVREPVVTKTHRRTGATDWIPVMSCIFGQGNQIQPTHRRSMAWTENECMEITWVCDELHGPWAHPPVRRGDVWNVGVWDLSPFDDVL